jgi:nitrogen fixation protein NifQ
MKGDTGSMQAQTIEPTDSRTQLHARLMACSRGRSNDEVLARMLASQATGSGALPLRLGLGVNDFNAMLDRHFPGAGRLLPLVAASLPDDDRDAERAELRVLMLSQRAGRDRAEEWIASIVATGCMGGDHLWQDLGLWARKDVTELMRANFPALAAKNDRDMKWKKFLYKQLCIQEGIYTCRSPSCEVCADYKVCFGPEE